MTPLWSIARKDLKILMRDRSALVFLFGFPLIFTAIFGAIYGGNGKSGTPTVKVLVANLDRGSHGAELVDALAKMGLAVKEERQGADAVAKRIRNGDQPMGLVIPADYSAELDAAVHAAAEHTANPPQARIVRYVDPAQEQMATVAQGAVNGALQRVTGPLYRKAAIDRLPEAFRRQAEQSASIGAGQPAVAFDTVEAQRAAQTDSRRPVHTGFRRLLRLHAGERRGCDPPLRAAGGHAAQDARRADLAGPDTVWQDARARLRRPHSDRDPFRHR